MTEIEILAHRLHNLEVAFMAYKALTDDVLPPAYAEEVDRMFQEFFEASQDLGAFQQTEFRRSQHE